MILLLLSLNFQATLNINLCQVLFKDSYIDYTQYFNIDVNIDKMLTKFVIHQYSFSMDYHVMFIEY